MPPRKGPEPAVAEEPPAASEDTVAVTEPGLAEGESSAVIEPGPGELDQVVSNLGDAVAREESKVDLSEEAHLTAIERMEGLGDNLELESPRLVSGVRDFLLDIIKSRPKPWGGTSPAEQRDVAAACDQLADGLVRQIVELVRAEGKKAVRVLLTKVTLGDDTQIVGKLKPMSPEEEDEAVMMLHHARGKHVLLTVASVDDYKQEHRQAQTDVEEPALPFEAGSDEHPDDDSDLVEAGGSEPGPHEPLANDGTLAEGERINLKTGMVERALEGGENGDWEDVREATPEELAAERERMADFDTKAPATA